MARAPGLGLALNLYGEIVRRQRATVRVYAWRLPVLPVELTATAMFEDWNGLIAGVLLVFGAVLAIRALKQVRARKAERARQARIELLRRGS